jgi:hypothetical protein
VIKQLDSDIFSIKSAKKREHAAFGSRTISTVFAKKTKDNNAKFFIGTIHTTAVNVEDVLKSRRNTLTLFPVKFWHII